MISEIATLNDAVAMVEDVPRGVVWVGEDGGLSRVDLSSGSLDRWANFAFAPAGIALSGDGSLVLISGTDGTVAAVSADDPSTGVDVLATAPQEPLGQAAATRPATGPGSALAASPSRSRAIAVSLADHLIRPVVSLTGITGIAAQGSRVFAAATTAGTGGVMRVAGGAAQGVAGGLLPTGHITVTPDGTALIVAHPTAARASRVALAGGTVETGATDKVDGTIAEVHQLADGRFAVLTDTRLAVADDFADLKARPTLVPPAEPLFVSSWVKLEYDLSGSGLGPDDITFNVVDGPDVAIVSHTQTLAGTNEAMLVAGGLLGRFGLEMVETATGTVLDTAEFEVTDEWHDPDNGPSWFFQGENMTPAPGFDWGGGPNAPQNMGTRPHNGVWRVAALLVNTSDGAYPTDAPGLAAARKAILDELQDGVSVSGTTRSARHYYEELSRFDQATNRGLTIRAHNNQVFGPVTLPNGWGTYFEQKKNAMGVVTDERWSSKGATVQTIVTRAFTDGVMSTADFSAIDVLLIVPFSPDTVAGTTTKRFVWPHASTSPQTYLAGKSATKDQRSFNYVFVPPDFPVHDGSGRRVHATLSHELGHTLGLPDLYDFPEYTDDVRNRLTPDWDMMGGSRNNMPHYTLSNRMRQGWVDAGHIELVNFAQAGAMTTRQVTLHAAELAPAPNRRRGIEIRLADGWNTYVEYRSKQAGQFGDTLPSDRRVVITDVTSDSFSSSIKRPPILFVHNDADGDGPILDSATDYEELDPGNHKKLVVSVVSTAADNAVVKVEYGTDGVPEPGIRPWTGPPDWQSPDIEVRNAKAQADPAKWFNTPWINNPNTVVAKVRNNGTLACKGVVVDFFAIEFSAGDGPLMQLGSDTKDIAIGATVEFTVPWTPPDIDNPHFCIVVRIRLYHDPTLAGVEETFIYNNEARSNYTRFVSASSSPSRRAAAEVLLDNPFDEPALVHAVLRSSHEFHRVFLDHRFLRIGGKSQRPVRVLDEALAGFPEAEELSEERVLSRLWKEDNRLSLEGWAARPFIADCGALTLTGGAAIRVGAGRATRIEITDAHKTYMGGTVRHVDDGSPATDGKVVMVAREVEEFGGFVTADTDVRNDGTWIAEFSGSLPGKEQIGEAHYLGSFGAAPCESERVPLEP
jgi:M6 family metalloprotease-like protein